MKTFLLCILFVLSQESFAEVIKVKFNEHTFLKYEARLWNYKYIKAMSNITPHIFELHENKTLKVFVQKETHLEKNPKNKKLVEEKCVEAGRSYQDSKAGTARILKIKNKNVCLIQLNKNTHNNYQIVYPIHFTTSSYDLISFSWSDKDEHNLNLIEQLVGSNL